MPMSGRAKFKMWKKLERQLNPQADIRSIQQKGKRKFLEKGTLKPTSFKTYTDKCFSSKGRVHTKIKHNSQLGGRNRNRKNVPFPVLKRVQSNQAELGNIFRGLNKKGLSNR